MKYIKDFNQFINEMNEAKEKFDGTTMDKFLSPTDFSKKITDIRQLNNKDSYILREAGMSFWIHNYKYEKENTKHIFFDDEFQAEYTTKELINAISNGDIYKYK